MDIFLNFGFFCILIFSCHKLNFRWCKVDIIGEAHNSKELEDFMKVKQNLRTEEKNGAVRRYIYTGDLYDAPNALEHNDNEEKLYVNKYEIQNGQVDISLEGYLEGYFLLFFKTMGSIPQSGFKTSCE